MDFSNDFEIFLYKFFHDNSSIMWIALLALYFLPAMVAHSRKHLNTTAIFCLNTLLGWTVLGWIGALIWSLTAVDPPKKEAIDASCPR